ncbi:hypothetical protein BDZ91DRAFT_733541 [Kalaharituber pfeilii]|nr:hypothetical protein BDZ91DRAFT_733541 [Kalaharituber pfeilii]
MGDILGLSNAGLSTVRELSTTLDKVLVGLNATLTHALLNLDTTLDTTLVNAIEALTVLVGTVNTSMQTALEITNVIRAAIDEATGRMKESVDSIAWAGIVCMAMVVAGVLTACGMCLAWGRWGRRAERDVRVEMEWVEEEEGEKEEKDGRGARRRIVYVGPVGKENEVRTALAGVGMGKEIRNGKWVTVGAEKCKGQ